MRPELEEAADLYKLGETITQQLRRAYDLTRSVLGRNHNVQCIHG
jgi:hypothetical protein